MTNKEAMLDVLAGMKEEEFAEYLIFTEDIPDGLKYICPDGAELYIYEDAVNHVAEWLKENHNEI